MKRNFKVLILMTILLAALCITGCGQSDAEADTSNSNAIKKSFLQLNVSLADVYEDCLEEATEALSTAVSASNDNGTAYGLPKVVSTLTRDDGDKLVLVNKQYTVSPEYYPTDMVSVDNSLSTNKNLKFKREAYDAYLEMLAAAQNEGINFLICSTYRSYETQEAIYNNYINIYGAEYTNTISAYPGRSEHHTGWAIDITSASMGYDLRSDFINYPEGIWINNHCSEYGFIVRYPKDKTDITGYSYEPWHLRYVGVDVAKEITSRGITLEEYLGKA